MAWRVITFRKAGDVTNGAAGLSAKSNLRDKRLDPLLKVAPRQKAVAPQEQKGQDADLQ
jgi:hypothetical protein